MAGNSAAFILGGEEILRTKEYVGIDPAEVAGVTADSWTEMFGHKISHNSYNAPLSVNTFKWGNKVSVTMGADTITNEVYHYNEKFAELIKAHKDLLKKRGNNDGYHAFIKKTSANKDVSNYYWSEDGNFSNCVGFQANEAFVYTCAGNINAGVDYITVNKDEIENQWTEKFVYGQFSINDNKLTFNDKNAVAFYDRHGNQEG